MIRFCIKKMKNIDFAQINDISNQSFFDKYANDGVIVVYKNESLEGIITYENYVKAHQESIRIQRERVIIGKDIFSQAHMLLDKDSSLVLLPVICERSILCFCYNNKKSSYLYYSIDCILNFYEKDGHKILFHELYPAVKKIRMIGFNEWTFRLYRIFKREGYLIDLIGALWKNIGVCSDKELMLEHEIFTVYGEGTTSFYASDVYTEFAFLVRIASINKLDIMYQLQSKYCGLFSSFYICLIPTLGELNERSMDELIRNKLAVSSDHMQLSADEIFETQFMAVTGLKSKEWSERKKADEKQFDQLTLSINGISALKIGDGKNVIYLIGPCIVSCIGCMVDESLMMYLYANICREGLDYSVIAIPCESWNFSYLLKCFESIPIRKNDFVFVVEQNIVTEYKSWKSDVDMLAIYNSRGNATWFYDKPIHTNKYGNEAVAAGIYREIAKKNLDLTEDETIVQKGELLDEQSREKIKQYIAEIKQKTEDIPKGSVIGAVVMNCNPFTLGHRYLIEYAAKKVDYLYVFILKEDSSFFTFEERYHLVSEGTYNLKNVRVFSSGDFIISLHTFPAYFRKESWQDIYADACQDAQIFANYIAPELNIKLRFVGEEPVDDTTGKYNRILHRTLEDIGINVCEIPRLEQNGRIISASQVRSCYKENKWDEMKKMVSEYVYLFLRNRKAHENGGTEIFTEIEK